MLNTEKTKGFRSRIESFGLARGTVDLFPYLGKPCKARQVCAGVGRLQMPRQPAVDRIDERPETDAVVEAQRIAQGVKRARIDAAATRSTVRASVAGGPAHRRRAT